MLLPYRQPGGRQTASAPENYCWEERFQARCVPYPTPSIREKGEKDSDDPSGKCSRCYQWRILAILSPKVQNPDKWGKNKVSTNRILSPMTWNQIYRFHDPAWDNSLPKGGIILLPSGHPSLQNACPWQPEAGRSWILKQITWGQWFWDSEDK